MTPADRPGGPGRPSYATPLEPRPPGASSSFTVTVNGERVEVRDIPSTTTALAWLRETGRTGTKEGCAEGDCGACTIGVVQRRAGSGTPDDETLRAVNSCLVLLPTLADREIVTVEGVAHPSPRPGVPGALHPVQAAMVERYGSQCGFCTPGFVISMLEAYQRSDLGEDGVARRAAVVDQLTGNLCRCTGYRPIRDAMLDALDARASGPSPTAPATTSSLPAAAIPTPALDYAGPDGARLVRPAGLADLLALKAAYGRDAVLLGGATEIGVAVNKAGARFPLLVAADGVPELRAIESDETEWRIGGAVTLTELDDAVGGEFPHVRDMLQVFASRQIRHRATLAGNLATAAPIGDMAPVLLALDAEVVLERIGASRRLPLAEFVTGYRTTVLAPDEVIRWVVIPRRAALEARVTRGGRLLLGSAKVAGRREMATSTVAAGFAVGLDDGGRVVHARLAYGGVAATPWRARAAEEALLGRMWPEGVGDAVAALEREVRPIDDVRGSAAYRRAIAAGLLERFAAGGEDAVLRAPSARDPLSPSQEVTVEFEPTAPIEGTVPIEPTAPFERSVPLERTAPFERTTPWAAPGQSRDLPHESAALHVTGLARYVDDEARRRPMLEAWPVLSTQARARIRGIDASAALAVPGVVTVLTARDVPGLNDVGAQARDEPLLADGEIAYHGQAVALVVAEDRDTAQAGARAVVVDAEPLPAVLGIDAAIAAGTYLTEPHTIRRGEVTAALTASPHRLAGDLRIGGQDHFSLETQAAWAEVGEGGTVTVHSATQHPTEVQAAVAHVLGKPRHAVVVTSPRMGGAFGGKETQGAAWAAAAALAAEATGHPVRVALDRDVHMRVAGKRHPFLARFEAGYADDGALLALRVALVSDGGYALDLSQAICDRALLHLDNAYFVPAMEVTGRVARTNTASNTAMRGFGGPQGMVVIEEVLDRIARRLGLPPERVRERNLYRGSGASRTTHYGQELPDLRVREVWDRVLEASGFAARRAEVAAWNATAALTGSRVRRGLAVTPVKFGISFTASVLNQAGAYVLVYRNGTVQVNHGGTEMGQGLHTRILGIAARELGVAPSAVRVMPTATDKVPNTSATAASSGSDLNGQAVAAACATLRDRLAPVAAALLEERARSAAGATASGVVVPAAAVRFAAGSATSPLVPAVSVALAEVVDRAWAAQVPLFAAGFYRTPGIGFDWSSGTGRPFHYFAHGAAVSEVEVDGWTGQTRVLAVDVVHDVGSSLNPGIDRGQVEGGFVQGMGWLTGEDLRWDDDGALLTHGASTYLVPTIGDAPARFRVSLLPRAAQEGVIHGSKAVGEPPFMLAISVREAIRDAVAAFDPAGHEEEVRLAIPATPEAVLRAIRARVGSPLG